MLDERLRFQKHSRKNLALRVPCESLDLECATFENVHDIASIDAHEVQRFEPSKASESGSERAPILGVCGCHVAVKHEAADKAGSRWPVNNDGVEDNLTGPNIFLFIRSTCHIE